MSMPACLIQISLHARGGRDKRAALVSALRQAYTAYRRVERSLERILTVAPPPQRDQTTAYCSIGFQPVSGRATRHPRKSVIHGTGTVSRHLHADQTTGWKPMLQYTVTWSLGNIAGMIQRVRCKPLNGERQTPNAKRPYRLSSPRRNDIISRRVARSKANFTPAASKSSGMLREFRE
jgi:hypothetical protein